MDRTVRSETVCPLCGGTVGQMGLDHVIRNLAIAAAPGFTADPFYYRRNRYPDDLSPEDAMSLALAHAQQALGLYGSPAGMKVDWRLELVDLVCAVKRGNRRSNGRGGR
jgi:hypothetical protein